ncbi:suppressor of glycerol defect [Malassezia nana]|uniref:Suppressor of glycerol defect n=1 Tax=Malassezia nana TaxID=180528 RepID=A0AAF0EJ79_9BASI|nr:suppressor of glycerol defect [Malassezia nana]
MGGGRDRARSTTRLPAALRDELGIDDGSTGLRKAKKPRLIGVSARKAARKEQRRAKHAARAPRATSAPSKTPTTSHAPLTARKEVKKPVPSTEPTGQRARAPPVPTTKQVLDPISGALKTVQASTRHGPTKLERMSGSSTKTQSRFTRLSQVERDEDDEIAWLEHQLSQGRSVREGDDVDDLLEDLDKLYAGMHEDDTEDLDNENEEGLEEDLEEDLDEAEEDLDEAEEDLDEAEEDLDEAEEDLDEAKEDLDEEDEDLDEAKEDLDEEDEDLNDDDDKELEDEGMKTENLETDLTEKASTSSSDPSTEPPSLASSSGGRYVPPALRQANPSIAQQKLQRLINGQLNRLGEGNVDSIVSELDGLYRSYARGDVTSTITRLVLDTISARANLSETVIVLYATLLTALHRLVGTEFGAYVLQELVSHLLDAYGAWLALPEPARADDEDAHSRVCVNLVTLQAHLFNLRMLSSGLLLDWVRLWLGQSFVTMVPGVSDTKPITELDIELILRLVQSSGAQLRHTDADALKAIVDVTKRSLDEAASSSPVAHSSRARFMLEALVHLRQKGKHLTRDSSATSERVQKMAKYLSGMEKRRTLRTQSALQVGLDDLQAAGHRGRWWLVGAAWAGHDAPPPSATPEVPDTASDDESMDLPQLARAQGMNTDARRSVFSTLMSSLDYQDAVRNLLQLKLSEVQRREIIRVLIHCLTQEPAFNPYYVLVGQQLALEQPGMRVTLQYVLWDYFRELGEAHVGGARVAHDKAGQVDETLLDDPVRLRKLVHLARAYGYWVATDSLSLNVLKPVDFTVLHGPATAFLQHLLLHWLLATQTQAPMLTPRLRGRLARAPTAQERERLERSLIKGTIGQPSLAQGLLVFLRLHMAPSQLTPLLGQEDAAVHARLVWATRTATETLSVGATVGA